MLGCLAMGLSEFEEETLSCLIQTGESFSSNLKHGPLVGDGRSLRCTAIVDPVFSNRAPAQYQVFSNRFPYVRAGSLASERLLLFSSSHTTSVGPAAWR